MPFKEEIHSCSWFCDRPTCVKEQRDHFRDNAPPPFLTFDNLEFVHQFPGHYVIAQSAVINLNNGYRFDVAETENDLDPYCINLMVIGSVDIFDGHIQMYEHLSKQDVTNIMRVLQTIPAAWQYDKTGE